MKITIIREDGAVYKDGYSYCNLVLSSIPQDVHALQFDTSLNTGWIEFTEDSTGSKQVNQSISSLPSWANDSLEKWEAANTAEQLKAAENK